MSDSCKAKTKAGERCRARPLANGLCALHGDPGKAAELGRKSGLKRRRNYSNDSAADVPLVIPKSAADVRDLLGDVMARVRAGKMDPKVGSTLGYIGTSIVKCIEVADLETRLERLEKLSTGTKK